MITQGLIGFAAVARLRTVAIRCGKTNVQGLDHDDFGSIRAEVKNVIDSFK